MKVRKKESRKESGVEKGRERGKKKGGKKEELPSLCCYSVRFERLSQQIHVREQLLCVVSPLIFTFPRVVSGYVERLSLAINLTINIYFPKEVVHTSNGEESAYANYQFSKGTLPGRRKRKHSLYSFSLIFLCRKNEASFIEFAFALTLVTGIGEQF